MPAFLSVRLRLVFSAVLALVATFPAAADSRFITPPTYSVATLHNPGPEPAGMATADLNGDGKPDLVVANFAGQNIAVLLNNGDGTFKPPVFYTTPQLNTPYAVVIADFNGDGKLDIVSGGEGGAGGQVTVFLGNGDGTFQAGVVYFVGNNGSAWVAAADMNGDGILDLVVPGDSGTGNGDEVVSVLLGVGDGTFQAPITTTLTYGAGSYDTLAAADFNKDGKTDIALLANGRLLLLLGNGNGTFQSPVDLQVQSNHMVIAADMNNDGNLDLITVSDSGVYVLLGNGNGTFQTAVSNTVSGGPLAIALSDLNGDGKLDVVVGGDSPSALQVLFGNGTATLGSPILYATGSGPAFAGAIVTADFNGDGYPDVVASNAGDADVSVLFGSQSGSLQSTVVSQAIAGPMVPGDFNNDGKLDVLSLFPGLYDFFLFFGEGNGALQPPAAFTVGSTAYFVTAADFNGDGNLDVASANVKNVSVALGKGDGTFQPLVNYTSNLGDSTYIAAPDLKGDGKPDLAVITRPTGGSAVIAIMLNLSLIHI